jgi:menaquinone-dependent protoporphyrinogen IX oxidase
MQGIIIYKSKYSSTKQYAEWIAEETNFPLRDLKEVTQSDIESREIVVICSYIHTGLVILRKWIINNWKILKNKNIFPLSASGTPPEEKKYIDEFFEKSFTADIREKIKYYPTRGKYIFKNMTYFDKKMIPIVAKFNKDKVLKEGMLIESFEISKII